MSLAVDQIVDRRRLRRKLTFWRIAALIALAALIVALAASSGIFQKFVAANTAHIARIRIGGVITEDKKLLDLIEKVGKKKQVKGVILSINSPGGSTVGGEAVFEAVRKLAGKKPVVTSVGTLATSAGYMIASASDHIVARRSSIVGSIGVLFQYPDASELLKTVGIKMEEVKSAPLKAEPSPFHPAPPEARAMLKRVVDDSYNWFIDLVSDRRPLSRAEVVRLADGTIFSGAQGLKNKLVDAIGGEEAAKAWLTKEKGLSEDLKVVEWKPDDDGNPLPLSSAILVWLAKQAGIDLQHQQFRDFRRLLPKRIFLDGLVSIWQASSPSMIKEGEFR